MCLLYTKAYIFKKCFLWVLPNEAKQSCSLKLHKKCQKYSSILNLKSRLWIDRKQVEDRNVIVLRNLCRESVSFPFPASRDLLHSLAHDPSSIFKASREASSNLLFCPASLFLWLNLLPASFPCYNAELTWIIQIEFLLSILNLITSWSLPWHVK